MDSSGGPEFDADGVEDGRALERIIAGRETLGALIDGVVQVDAMVSQASAWRAMLLEQALVWAEANAEQLADPEDDSISRAERREFARRALVMEVGAAIRVPERTAARMLEEAHTLVGELPHTLEAMRAGRVGIRQAQTIVDQVWSLGIGASNSDERLETEADTGADAGAADTDVIEASPDEVRAQAVAAFEARVLPYAEQQTPSKFERKARRLREVMHPETIRVRRERAAADREVRYTPDRDGMAWLSMYLEAPVAVAVFHRVTAEARTLQASDASRTLTQLRADVAADLLLTVDECDECRNGPSAEGGGASDRHDGGSPGSGTRPVGSRDSEPSRRQHSTSPRLPESIRPTVLVTVPVLTLLGVSEEPATLEGYGPIDAETARDLCARAPSFTRILTHPESGAVLSVGRDSYRVPTDLRRALRVRDGTCRAPGCNRSAADCDIDHTQDWQYGGETSIENLSHMCRSHHRLKHNTRWHVRQARDGTQTWTAPSGRTYRTEPDDFVGSGRGP